MVRPGGGGKPWRRRRRTESGPPGWLSCAGLMALGLAAAALAVDGLVGLLVAVWASWVLFALAGLFFALLALRLWRRRRR